MNGSSDIASNLDSASNLIENLRMKLFESPCSCCKGSLTFEESHHVKQQLTGLREEPNPKAREFRKVSAAAWLGR